MLDKLSEVMGSDIRELSEAELHDHAEKLDISGLDGAGWGKLIDKLFSELVQPTLIQPTFVMDHPKDISPLAKPHRNHPDLTERFELFIAGEEIPDDIDDSEDKSE